MGVRIASNYFHPSQALFSSSPRFLPSNSVFSCVKNTRTGCCSAKPLHSKRRALNQMSDAMSGDGEEEEQEEELTNAIKSSFVRPEPPKWVKMKAYDNIDAPLSLQIAQKKKSCSVEEAGECSIKKAFSSMLFILRELQSYTLQMRESLCYENLHGVVERVHGELNASFVWLFQQIFSCTPTFMVSVMLLLANFTVYSIGTSTALASISLNPPAVVEQQTHQDDAAALNFVAPIKAEMEAEDVEIYSKTETMYYKLLSEDPHSALILANLAQFFYLVHHDHDRAEYYFKKAVDVKPRDAEALNRYANFLWLAKNDLGAAEDNYLEAIAAEPGNAYYAANYAHFLWNTGGEETCYPIDGSSRAC